MSASSPVVRSSGAPQITWSQTFPATPQQVGEARRFLAAILDDRATADDAVLCLSELASNAVLHSRSASPGAQFTVRATLKNDQLRVEVSDDGGPWHWPDGDDDQHGRGLVIVSRLATAWGRAGTPDTGWTVWYTMTCPPVRLPRPWTTVIDGHRLRQLRRERELSQVELAGKAGVSLATVVRLERHPQGSCRSRTLSRLAAALGEDRSRLTASGCQGEDRGSRRTLSLHPGGGDQ
jgi:serine/threonine-protein kinase RsbW